MQKSHVRVNGALHGHVRFLHALSHAISDLNEVQYQTGSV